jgi:hypothetical protein
VCARQLAHRPHGRSIVGLGGLKPLRILLSAEIRAEEDLLQTHDLRALPRRVADHLDVLVEHVLLGKIRVRLDQRCAYRASHSLSFDRLQL